MRHAAHTSEVDAPQAAQGERDGAGDDMAATGAGGQREAREVVRGSAVSRAAGAAQPPAGAAPRHAGTSSKSVQKKPTFPHKM